MNPVEPVERQVEAYNAHDLERFVAEYARDIEVFRPPRVEPVLRGREAFARHYAENRFSIPGLRAEILSRMVIGNTVIDHERIFGLPGGTMEAAAVYAVEAGYIAKVWFFQ